MPKKIKGPPRLSAEVRNLRVLPSGYQVTITRQKREYSKHFAGHSKDSLQKAMKYRDRLLRMLPKRRRNAVPRRVLSGLGLKEPVLGISRSSIRRMYQVGFKDERGRQAARSFYWRAPGEEINAYANAMRFRKKLLREAKRR